MKTRLILLALAAALAACSVQGPEVPEVPEAPVSHAKTFHASVDGGTKTSLSLQPSQTSADVLWDSGDRIVVYADSLGLRSYSRVFTTVDGGTNSADFTCDDWDLPFKETACIAFYPEERYRAISMGSDGRYRVSVVVPVVQNAVKGGIERGMNIGIAYSTDGSDHLHFKNVHSLVRFTLAGEKASQVRRVVFKSTGVIAGDGAYIVSAEGGAISMSTRFNPIIYGSANSVELVGDFENGGDYYIAVVPATSDGFSFTFYDADGNVISRSSSKPLTLSPSRIADFGIITLDDSFEQLPSGVERYMTQTKGSNPVVLAVIGDGFTEEQQSLFTTLARSAMDQLFDTEPFRTYRDWFNVYLMSAVSNESCASVTDGKGNITEEHDTAFKSRWGKDVYDDMRSDFTAVGNFVKARCPEILNGTITVAEVPILMIINDTRYGGMCYNWEDGSCVAHVPYINNGSGSLLWQFPLQVAADNADPSAGVRNTTDEEFAGMGGKYYNTSSLQGWFTSKGNWRNIVVHEFGGHGFGRLDDEYWYDPVSASASDNTKRDKYHTWAVPFCLNTSSTYENAPWQAELLDQLDVFSQVDARYAERSGLFQGASGYALNRWRPEMVSCMIDNRLYFSTWQRMLIVKRIMEKAGETFTLEGFLQNDNPTDRLRDQAVATASRRGGTGYLDDESAGPYMFCPPLPPPVLIDR